MDQHFLDTPRPDDPIRLFWSAVLDVKTQVGFLGCSPMHGNSSHAILKTRNFDCFREHVAFWNPGWKIDRERQNGASIF